jgi:hypothetical protein
MARGPHDLKIYYHPSGGNRTGFKVSRFRDSLKSWRVLKLTGVSISFFILEIMIFQTIFSTLKKIQKIRFQQALQGCKVAKIGDFGKYFLTSTLYFLFEG